MGQVALLSHFHLQHEFGCEKLNVSFNVDVKVDIKSTGVGNQAFQWEEKTFNVEGLARAILHYCDSVCLTGTTLQNGTSYWSDHFDPNNHPVNASVQFVYIVYGKLLNRHSESHIFGGEYKVISTEEAHFVKGLWLKVVCIFNNREKKISIHTAFANVTRPIGSDVPTRLAGSIDIAHEVIFLSCTS